MTRLYISGPVTGIENDNIQAFEDARRKLRRYYMVDIPHEYVYAGAPHEEAMVILVHQLTSNKYSYVHDKRVNRYDGVALLPGWEQSEGARLEREMCIRDRGRPFWVDGPASTRRSDRIRSSSASPSPTTPPAGATGRAGRP